MRIAFLLTFMTSSLTAGCGLFLDSDDGDGSSSPDGGSGDAASDGASDPDAGGNFTNFQQPYDCDSSTLALYHFSAGAEAVESCRTAEHSLTGTIATSAGPPTAFGEAAEISQSNDDSIAATMAPTAGAGLPLTIEAWIRTPSQTIGAPGVQFGASIRDQVSLQVQTGGGGWAPAADIFQADCVTRTVLFATDLDFNTDEWHHIAVVATANAVELFVNGASVDSHAGALCDPSGDRRLNVGSFEGSYAGTFPESFGHAIDELRISNVDRLTP